MPVGLELARIARDRRVDDGGPFQWLSNELANAIERRRVGVQRQIRGARVVERDRTLPGHVHIGTGDLQLLQMALSIGIAAVHDRRINRQPPQRRRAKLRVPAVSRESTVTPFA